MKVSVFAVITVAMVGVNAVPVENGPLAHLQVRASEAIGGVVSFIRRDDAGHAVVPQQLRRASPVRFHNARDADHEYITKRKDGDGKGEKPVPPLNPFSKGEKEKRADPDLTKRADPKESVPPLAPFSVEDEVEE